VKSHELPKQCAASIYSQALAGLIWFACYASFAESMHILHAIHNVSPSFAQHIFYSIIRQLFNTYLHTQNTYIHTTLRCPTHTSYSPAIPHRRYIRNHSTLSLSHSMQVCHGQSNLTTFPTPAPNLNAVTIRQ
jgi:hypothetical protein